MHALRSWIGMTTPSPSHVAAPAAGSTAAAAAAAATPTSSDDNSQWPALHPSGPIGPTRAASATLVDDDWTVLQAASCNSGPTRTSTTTRLVISFRDAALRLRGQTPAEAEAAAAAATRAAFVAFGCTPPAAPCRSETGDSQLSIISARSMSPFQCSSEGDDGLPLRGAGSESGRADLDWASDGGDAIVSGACECAALRLTEEACRSCAAANDERESTECESDYWRSALSLADVRFNSCRGIRMLSFGWTPTAGNGGALFRQRHKQLSHFFVSSRYSLRRLERWSNDHIRLFLPGKSRSLLRLQNAARTCGLCGESAVRYCRCDRSRRFDERPAVAHSPNISVPFVFTNGRWTSKDDPGTMCDDPAATVSRRDQLPQRRAAARHLRAQLDAHGAERIPRHKRPSSAASQQQQVCAARPAPSICALAPSDSAGRARVRLTDACSFDDLRLRAFLRYGQALADAGRSSRGAMVPTALRLAPLEERAQRSFMQSLSAQRVPERQVRLCFTFTPRVHMERIAREGFAAQIPRGPGAARCGDDEEDEGAESSGACSGSTPSCLYPVWERALMAYQFPLRPVKGEQAYERTMLVCAAIAPPSAKGEYDSTMRVEAHRMVPLFLLDFSVPGAQDDSVRRLLCGVRSLAAKEGAPTVDRGLVRRVLRREHDRERARQRLLAAAPIVSILAPLPSRAEAPWETCMGRAGGWHAAQDAGSICDECEIGCRCCRGVCQRLSAEQTALIQSLDLRHRQWCADLRMEAAFEERNLIVRSQPVAKAYDKRRRLSGAGFSFWSDFK